MSSSQMPSPGHIILVEFPDLEKARAWYRSPSYQAIVKLRTSNSDGACVLVDGVPADHKATDILADLGLASGHSSARPQAIDTRQP